ncbi:MAG: ATP-dependent DNA helicase [Proteobacteria bacterium]|nr:ATP-dependent DNA helicase [Pseudomonadota bacterium]MDE3208901.1 ATP-dependent DNA helicase [Pseudomonadota bacterium]
MLTLDEIFSEGGPLAQVTGRFRVRPQQQEMARAILRAIEKHDILIAEAGTGTGKTYAYLVPALLAGGKTVISTGTKTLQDQLFYRDVPQVRRALNVSVTVSLLKGRANYVCHYYLERAKDQGRFSSREEVIWLGLIDRFAQVTDTGDKSELTDVPEDASVWMQVTSTRDNCLGQNCPHHKSCFVLEARRKAQAADIVIVNHHLFFADLMLKDEGVAEILPASTTVIFDEAHQLPQIASVFFGQSLGTSQLVQFAQDLLVEARTSAKDSKSLPQTADALEHAARDLRLVLPEESLRLSFNQAKKLEGFDGALMKLQLCLEETRQVLQLHEERSTGLHNCLERAEALLDLLDGWTESVEDSWIRWMEVFGKSLQLHATPLSIAGYFGQKIESNSRSWIFTSATLAVEEDFTHYQEQMGLLDAKTLRWESPFDYTSQAMLYVPRGLPDPRAAGYTRQVVNAALPVIQAAGGKTFFLFTSLRAMREAQEYLREIFLQNNISFPLLMQGENPKSLLLEEFRHLGNAVLLASQSFWEGVDVRGEALSLVIIDKLPFEPPDDPVLSARMDDLRLQGKNAFMVYQLPQAILTLKQGAGRLIRDVSDRGVLMICDPRIVEKSYGKRIWRSLPPMTRSRHLDEVVDFYSGFGGHIEISGV